MKRKELEKIISYINDSIRETISTDDSVTNDLIDEGFFSEKEFVEKFIVEIDDDEQNKQIKTFKYGKKNWRGI